MQAADNTGPLAQDCMTSAVGCRQSAFMLPRSHSADCSAQSRVGASRSSICSSQDTYQDRMSVRWCIRMGTCRIRKYHRTQTHSRQHCRRLVSDDSTAAKHVSGGNRYGLPSLPGLLIAPRKVQLLPQTHQSRRLNRHCAFVDTKMGVKDRKHKRERRSGSGTPHLDHEAEAPCGVLRPIRLPHDIVGAPAERQETFKVCPLRCPQTRRRSGALNVTMQRNQGTTSRPARRERFPKQIPVAD